MEALFVYLLKSAGILTIFFLAYKFLMQKETFFSLNRHYLLGGIIASLLLPLIVFESYIYVEPEESIIYDIPASIIDASTIKESTPFDWNTLLFNIYILGVIMISSQFLIQLYSLHRIVKSGVIKNYNSFKLIEVSENVSPFSFFNYIIYNPKKFSEKELEIILNHEKAHGKQLHSIDILVSQMFVVFQWFNPIVWLYKKTIQQNLEFLADKEAISNIQSKKKYQHTLLKVSVEPYCTSITNNFYNSLIKKRIVMSLIKKRIVMLNQSSSKTRNLWKYALILPALALFLVSFNTKTVEIVKENKVAINEAPNRNNLEIMEYPIIPPVKNNVSLIASEKEESQVAEKTIVINDVIVKITKDTTKEELDNMQKDLEKKGMEFSYSKLDFNSEGEITNIKIKFRNEATGSNSSYIVNTDDDEPIKAIYIYTQENGGYGIGNSPDGREHEERMEEHKEHIYEHKLKMKEHGQKVKEEHEERIEEERQHMEEQKAQLKEEHEERVKKLKKRHKEMKVEQEEREYKLKERKAREKNSTHIHVSNDGNHTNTFVYSKDSSSNNSRKVEINSNGKDPIYVVDGEITSKKDFKNLDTDEIATINVFKGKNAIAIYGKKAKDGVIQIVTKRNISPRKGTKYHFADNTASDFEKVYLIEKNCSDRLLNSYKGKLKDQGIDFKFSGIKRNRNGEITRIKLRLDNNSGSKTSTVYDTSPNVIPTIVIGKKDGKFTISSSK